MQQPAEASISEPTLDPVTFEVLWHKLMQLAEEMGIAYFRTTASHVVITGTDAASAIMTADGEAVAVGPFIVTQANVLPLIVRSVIAQCADDPGINPGDVFICNDPYAGAIHQQDIATVAPLFDGDRIIGWVGTSGHQVDNGGSDPGGFSVSAREIHQEGLRMPPVKLIDGGRLREDVMRWIDNQVRDHVVALDIRAQIATLHVGIATLQQLCDRYGADALVETMAGIIAYAEKRFADRLRSLPDGSWERTQFIDHDGHDPNIFRIVCRATKRDDELELDFSGSSENARGIINSTFAGLTAACLSAAFILLAHDLPWNSGVRRRLRLMAAPGTVNNAAYPAPVTMATVSATIVTIDAVWGCISDMLLESDSESESIEAMANWSGTSMAPIFTGVLRDGEPFAHTEMSHFGGGGGARVYADGVDSAGIVFNTTPNIPNIEVNEQDFPVLYLFRRHLIDSGGPGRHRGGMSAELAYIRHKTDADMESLFAGTGSYMPNALGLAGGMPGNAVLVLRVRDSDARRGLDSGNPLPASLEEAGGAIEVLEPKHPRSPFGPDDIWYHAWQAGGGYGDPLDRDPASVAADVIDRAVSRDVARRVFGVVLDDNDDVVPAATTARRTQIRAERLGTTPSVVVPTEGSDAPDLVKADDGAIHCGRCGHAFAAASRGAVLAEAVSHRGALDLAGPIRGEHHGDRGFRLDLRVCPSCASLLDVSLNYIGDLLVAPPAAPAEEVI